MLCEGAYGGISLASCSLSLLPSSSHPAMVSCRREGHDLVALGFLIPLFFVILGDVAFLGPFGSSLPRLPLAQFSFLYIQHRLNFPFTISELPNLPVARLGGEPVSSLV